MLRWIIRIFGILLLLVAIVAISVFMLPAERIAKIATDQISKATGRAVKISGDVQMTLYPVLGVKADGLEIGNADWSDQGPMLKTARAAIGLDAMALLGGDIVIRNIDANSPTIRLQSRKDGRANWQFTENTGETQAQSGTVEQTADAGGQQSFWVKQLRITDATLIYDAEGADLVKYADVDLALDWPERSGAAKVDAKLSPAGSPVRVNATIGAFSGFLAGQVQTVDLTLASGANTARLAGRASLSGALAGALTLEVPDSAKFLAALGSPGFDLPAGLGRSVNATVDLTLTENQQLALRGLKADLGGNTISGDADIALTGVPQVNAKLTTGALNLSGLGGSEGSGGGANQGQSTGGATNASQGWSAAPLDASGLSTFNGAISLNAASIDFGSMKLGKTRALLTNDRARMVFELREATAYGGTLSGEFVANNRNGLSVGGKLFGRKLQMQGLLTDLADVTRLTGAADAELKFLGVGQSVRAIMQSLSGNGAIKLGRGTIEGIDLDRLMRSGDGSGGTTVFDSLTASFDMKGGNLRNRDLLALLPNFEARGEGRIGLGAQDIDYLFTPKALRGNDGKGIAIPVKIKGPWSRPRITPDLEKAIDLNFAEERKKIENKVKQEVQKKVQKELGVTVNEGQSIEDAIEKKIENQLEDKLKKGLRKLFD